LQLFNAKHLAIGFLGYVLSVTTIGLFPQHTQQMLAFQKQVLVEIKQRSGDQRQTYNVPEGRQCWENKYTDKL